MKDIVIVGAGPIGLYWAAKLAKLKKQYNLPITIKVVDKRAGTYNRARIVSNEAIGLVEKQFDIIVPRQQDIPNEAMHINDLEKCLYTYCASNGVKFIQAQFKNINADSVTITQNGSEDSNIPCDTVIDCSGSNRAVVTKVQSDIDKAAFPIESIGENPHINHISCYAVISAEDEKKLHQKKQPNHALAGCELLKLRQDFAWPDYAEPDFYINRAQREDGKFNIYLYIETPPELHTRPLQEQMGFIQAILRLRYQLTDNIDLKVASQGHFLVAPKVIKKHMFESSKCPTVLVAGDCQIEPDYRKGIGIESGIRRADAFFSSIKLSPEGIQFDSGRYYAGLAQMMGHHQHELEKFYRERQSYISKGCLENARVRLCAAADILDDPILLAQLATDIKELGTKLLNNSSKESALACYMGAITALEKAPGAGALTLQASYANACLILNKLGRSNECIELADKYIENTQGGRNPDDNLMFKLLSRQCDAIANICKQLKEPRDKEVLQRFSGKVGQSIALMKTLQVDGIKDANKYLSSAQETESTLKAWLSPSGETKTLR